jgi:hypothetical protein
MFGNKMKMGLANSIIPKNVLTGLQTEEDLEATLTEPKANIVEVGEIDEEVEIDDDVETHGETKYVETRDIENKIPARTQKIKQHREESVQKREHSHNCSLAISSPYVKKIF